MSVMKSLWKDLMGLLNEWPEIPLGLMFLAMIVIGVL